MSGAAITFFSGTVGGGISAGTLTGSANGFYSVVDVVGFFLTMNGMSSMSSSPSSTATAGAVFFKFRILNNPGWKPPAASSLPSIVTTLGS